MNSNCCRVWTEYEHCNSICSYKWTSRVVTAEWIQWHLPKSHCNVHRLQASSWAAPSPWLQMGNVWQPSQCHFSTSGTQRTTRHTNHNDYSLKRKYNFFLLLEYICDIYKVTLSNTWPASTLAPMELKDPTNISYSCRISGVKTSSKKLLLLFPESHRSSSLVPHWCFASLAAVPSVTQCWGCALNSSSAWNSCSKHLWLSPFIAAQPSGKLQNNSFIAPPKQISLMKETCILSACPLYPLLSHYQWFLSTIFTSFLDFIASLDNFPLFLVTEK